MFLSTLKQRIKPFHKRTYPIDLWFVVVLPLAMVNAWMTDNIELGLNLVAVSLVMCLLRKLALISSKNNVYVLLERKSLDRLNQGDKVTITLDGGLVLSLKAEKQDAVV